MKTRLIIVRHAEAEGNIKRIFHGWTDSDITEKGHKQAKLAAKRLADMKIDVIYSSSLKRTLKTAQYIADIKNLPIIRTDKLKEINGGDWEDCGWHELPEKWPEHYDTWENSPHIHVMPNGESMVELQERIVSEIETIISKNKGKSICIVTHGTAIKSLMCHLKGCSLEDIITIPWYDNTAITIADYEDGVFNILVDGDTSHLTDELSTIKNQEWYKNYNNKYLEGNQE